MASGISVKRLRLREICADFKYSTAFVSPVGLITPPRTALSCANVRLIVSLEYAGPSGGTLKVVQHNHCIAAISCMMMELVVPKNSVLFEHPPR